MLSRPSSKRSTTSVTRRERPDLAQPVLVGVDDAERHALLEALSDQLAVARLEDVQRHLLGGQQDEAERKEADLSISPTESYAQPTPGDAICVTRRRLGAASQPASGMRASSAWPSASRTGSSSIRSSTSWKKPRTISRSASARERPRAIA